MGKVKIIYPLENRVIEAKVGEPLKKYIVPNYLCGKSSKRPDEIFDFSYIIKGDEEEILLLDFSSDEGKQTFWHTSSHILAQAVKRLFPDAKLAIGPPIEQGFYYDFLVKDPFKPEDIEKIEKEMKKIIGEDFILIREEKTKEELLKLFEERKEELKLELVQELQENPTIYKQGDFVDLCKGPHLHRTGIVKSIKILSIASSYWRGDEKNVSLQRIYGISFPSEKEMEEYIKNIESAKKRDHRKLGRELELFNILDGVGAGLVIWYPNGAIVRKIMEDFLFEEHIKRGYLPCYTPHIGKEDLWRISGHLNFYKENMYPEITISEKEKYYIKPMNCPFHIQIYKSKIRSYRELPLRFFEFGNVYRYERSGVLHGLIRVRGFTQDDAHIFCKPEEVKDEIKRVIDFTLYLVKIFGFERYEVYISTKPEQCVGTEEMWEFATQSLILSAQEKGIHFKIARGEGAFYGPKIDIQIEDALKRKWQCTTIQFDFNLPHRFEVKYTDADGKEKEPYLIHRALVGSLERFFGLLIEHYAGNFPLWLAPVQIRILPITDAQIPYAEKISALLKEKKIRVEIDARNEKISYKIGEAERNKIPYIIVIGERETQNNTISVRRHTKGDMGSMKFEEFFEIIKREIERELSIQ